MGGFEFALAPGAPRAGADAPARFWRSTGVLALSCSAAALLGVSVLGGGAFPGPRVLGVSSASNQTPVSSTWSVRSLERPSLAPRVRRPSGLDDATAAPAPAGGEKVRARRHASRKEGVWVTISGVSCLKPDGSGDTPDPLFKCKLPGGASYKSKIKADTETPQWNEKFFVPLSLNQAATIKCQIQDKDPWWNINDDMGEFSIRLRGGKSLPDGRVQTNRWCYSTVVFPGSAQYPACGNGRGNLPMKGCIVPRPSVVSYQVVASSR